MSLIAGFSAPIGVAALAFGDYSRAVFPGLSQEVAAVGLIAFVTSLHAIHVVLGSSIQTVFTILKVALILVFIIAGLSIGDGTWGKFGYRPAQSNGLDMVGGFLPVQLFWVSFAYSGWNAAAYIAGEIKEPGRNLPRALFIGTAVVTVLYLVLNLVFLYAAPADKLSTGATGQQVGTSAAIALFGHNAGVWLSTLIALALVSTVSAMVMAGPRVYTAMAEDGLFFRFLAKRHAKGGPIYSVLLQGAIAIVLALTVNLDELVKYIGFTLSIFAALAVVAAMVLRSRRPDAERPYRTIGWPVTPILFLMLSAWLIVQGIRLQPKECLLWGGSTLLSGVVLYFLWSAFGSASNGKREDAEPA